MPDNAISTKRAKFEEKRKNEKGKTLFPKFIERMFKQIFFKNFYRFEFAKTLHVSEYEFVRSF